MYIHSIHSSGSLTLSVPNEPKWIFFVSLGPIEFEECNTAIATEGTFYYSLKDAQKQFKLKAQVEFHISKVMNV